MRIERKPAEIGPMFVLQFESEQDRDGYFKFLDGCVEKLSEQGGGDAFKRLVLKMKNRTTDEYVTKRVVGSSVLFTDEVGVFILGLMDVLRK